MSMTPEKRLQAKWIRTAKSLGLEVIRLALQPGVTSGWPDALMLGPGGRSLFVEFKSPGKKPTALQWHRMMTLTALGHDTIWTDGRGDPTGAIALQRLVPAAIYAARGGAPDNPDGRGACS